MNRLGRVAVVLCLACAAVISGCAIESNLGHTFNYAATSSLELGQLTQPDCQSTFGESPQSVTHEINADGKYDHFQYLYVHTDTKWSKLRSALLEFKDGKLNSYIYFSSFDGEETSVPTKKIDQLKKGESTMADTLKLLGKPNGKSFCPSTLPNFKDRCEGGAEVWEWLSFGRVATETAARGTKPDVTTLFITFDKGGIVNKIQSTSTSLKGSANF